MSELKNRIDFVYIIDVQDGNPNGDPDAGNLPRVDAETGMGLITDVCLKRKIRNYVQISRKCAEGFDIFIKEKAVLDDIVDNIYDQKKKEEKGDKKDGKKKEKEDKDVIKGIMCKTFFDVRSFGAVIATSGKTDRVTGPIQLTFSRSVDPIVISEHAITRVAVTKKSDESKEQTIGRKATVPYGLYVCHGFISANRARNTGFDEADLELFWEALRNMFECDRSAARGLMSARKLYVFSHATELGNAPASALFDRVHITRKDPNAVARSFADYEVTVDTEGLSEKQIQLTELIDGL